MFSVHAQLFFRSTNKQRFVRGPGNEDLHLIPKTLLERRLSLYTIMQLPKEMFFFILSTRYGTENFFHR